MTDSLRNGHGFRFKSIPVDDIGKGLFEMNIVTYEMNRIQAKRRGHNHSVPLAFLLRSLSCSGGGSARRSAERLH